MQYKGHSLQKQSVGVDMGISEQKDSSFQMMEGKGSMDFFDSGGLSCRLLYRTSGLDGSIHLLLQLVREIFPIIRLNIVSGSSDLRVFVPIADTLPNGLTRVRDAGQEGPEELSHHRARERSFEAAPLERSRIVQAGSAEDRSVRYRAAVLFPCGAAAPSAVRARIVHIPDQLLVQ